MGNMQEQSTYLDWESVVDNYLPDIPEQWDIVDTGTEYMRLSNGSTLIHITRVKLMEGVAYLVQKSNGNDEPEDVYNGTQPDIMANYVGSVLTQHAR